MLRRRDPAVPSEGEAPAVPLPPQLPRRVVDVPLSPVGTLRAVALGERLASRSGLGHVARGDMLPRQLAVGEGLRIQGEIGACDRLVIHGLVTAVLEHAQVLGIGRGGRFDGRADVETADIAGRFEGELTVRGRLLVRGTGLVEGVVRFGELEVERGGQVIGSLTAHAAPTPIAPVAVAQGD